jgi:hypothetical protein
MTQPAGSRVNRAQDARMASQSSRSTLPGLPQLEQAGLVTGYVEANDLGTLGGREAWPIHVILIDAG